MMRFQFHPEHPDDFAFDHFAIEGDNSRGYVFLAWNDPRQARENSAYDAPMMQLWFETLGEAMRMSQDEFAIPRELWQAPTMAPPIVQVPGSGRRPGSGESSVLNPDALSDRKTEKHPELSPKLRRLSRYTRRTDLTPGKDEPGRE